MPAALARKLVVTTALPYANAPFHIGHRRLQSSRCRALRGWRPPGAGATAPLHHPPALPGSALANERVQTNAAGHVVLKLKTPWRDGTTHLVMWPLRRDR